MKEAQIIHHTVHLTRCNLLRHGYPRQSCIASTKATTEALKQLGFLVRPIVVSAAVFTQGWLDMLEAGERPRSTEELDEQWAKRRAWSTGVPYDATPVEGAFTGHMVCLVRDRYLCDPSADQMASPQRGLDVRPLVVPFGSGDVRAFMRGEKQAISKYNDREGSHYTLVYSMFPQDRSHRTSPDWKDWQERYGEVVIQTVRYMKTVMRLDEPPSLPPVPAAPNSPGMVGRTRSPEELRRLRFVDGD